ncbi:MAG: plasmid pRiA4b ORF-3 family protein [Acidobacteriota bacterium]
MTNREVWITLPRRRSFKNVYQFKITLRGTRPSIWRRIQVPERYTFYDLHVAIQDAMGWLDYHLHMFEVKDEHAIGGCLRFESPFSEPDFEEEGLILTTEVAIKAFFKKARDRALYTYDYGDGWRHDVILEKVLRREPGKIYPVCLDGKLSGPPEDCGAIPGYYECVKAVKKKDNSDGLLTWLGSWKPDDFSPQRVKFENPRSRLKTGMDE